MLLKNIFFIVLLPFISLSDNPYDTSTPKKFVESLGMINQQPKSENPLPYFYEKEFAVALTNFDETNEKGLIEFNKFRNLISNQFPTHVKENKKGKINIALDGFAGMKTRSFSYKATMIGAQLKERKQADYEFVSATEPDENNISKLTLKILGNQKTIPIKKTKEGYRMFLSKDVLENVSKSIKKANKLKEVFVEVNKMIEDKVITKENFEEKIEKISTKYMEAL